MKMAQPDKERQDPTIGPAFLLANGCFNPGHCFLNIFVAVESADPDKALAAGAEPGPGGADHPGIIEQLIEKAPGVFLPVYPDVR